MNEKAKLEALILRSLLEFPNKIDEFLELVPMKCFCEIGSEILAQLLELNKKSVLSLEVLNNEIKQSTKQTPFYFEFVAALPNILVLELGKTLIKAYKLEVQQKLIRDLDDACKNNKLVDLSILQQELSIESKNYLNLFEWMQYYKNKPKSPIINLGVEFLNSCLNGGIELGQLVLIGGDPEAGKTMLGLQIIEHIAKNHKAAFFCFEFTIEQYLKRVEQKAIKTNFNNIICLNDGYNILELKENIEILYKKGIKIFFIDSQMRITNIQGRNMEEEETAKFSILARLCHTLNIVIFLVIQNAKSDKENPMGSKKGGHEASIIIRIEKIAPPKNDLSQLGNVYDEKTRMIIVQKNKQTGKHFKEKVFFNPATLKFHSLEKADADYEKVSFNENKGFLNEY